MFRCDDTDSDQKGVVGMNSLVNEKRTGTNNLLSSVESWVSPSGAGQIVGGPFCTMFKPSSIGGILPLPTPYR